MVNKKNIWFLTLFCLILVLSVYYVTMPSELLMTTHSNYMEVDINDSLEVSGDSEPTVSVSESNILTSLRIESEEKVSDEISELQAILVNADASVEEKNNAYEMIKNLRSDP